MKKGERSQNAKRRGEENREEEAENQKIERIPLRKI